MNRESAAARAAASSKRHERIASLERERDCIVQRVRLHEVLKVVRLQRARAAAVPGCERQHCVHTVFHAEGAVRAALPLAMAAVPWLASEGTRPEGVTVAETLEAVLMARRPHRVMKRGV